MEDLANRVNEAIQFITKMTSFSPKTGIILGTGLGGLSRELVVQFSIPYREIPFFPKPTVKGHEGMLLMGFLNGQKVALFHGRIHYYEGYSMKEVTMPVRLLKGLGAEYLIITNAAGGLNPLFNPGDIMLIHDHINLMPENPLRGIVSESLGNRFPDLSNAYDRQSIEKAKEVALEIGIHVREGVYVAIPGPSLETASETRLLRSLGADAVGMSTVPEVIVARSVGLKVLGLSVISNVNRPDAFKPILIDEIISNTKKAEPILIKLIKGVVGKI
jgi:purine-nucleoside phosphorylase